MPVVPAFATCTRMRSAEQQQLRQLRADDDDGDALRRPAREDQVVDLRAWRRRRCRGSARRAAGRAAPSPATCRSRPSAGCRRESVPAGLLDAARSGSPSVAIASRAERRLAADATQAEARQRGRSSGSATLSSIESPQHAGPSRLRSSVTSASPAALASRGERIVDRLAVDADLAAARARRATPNSGLEDLRAAGAEQAGDAEDLAGVRRRRSTPSSTRRQPRRGRRLASDRSAHRQHGGRAGRGAASRGCRERGPMSRPTIAAMIRSASGLGHRPRSGRAAPSRSTVTRSASCEDLVDAVRDVDDRDAVAGELADDREQPLRTRPATAPRSARP